MRILMRARESRRLRGRPARVYPGWNMNIPHLPVANGRASELLPDPAADRSGQPSSRTKPPRYTSDPCSQPTLLCSVLGQADWMDLNLGRGENLIERAPPAATPLNRGKARRPRPQSTPPLHSTSA